jgi:DNA-binding GntR family transcriptional regulator
MSSIDSPMPAGDMRPTASAGLSQPLTGLPSHHAGSATVASELFGGAATALAIRPARRIKSVQMTIKEQLIGEIISGRLAPGTRLIQADLARQFGVSLTPIREALRELCSEGLADIDPFVGVTVHKPTLDSLREVYEMRSALEPLTIPRSGWRLSAGQLAEAAKLITEMDQEIDRASWTAANRVFHDLLRSNSRNQRALVTLERLENLSDMYVSLSIGTRDDANTEHREMLEAHRSGRREAVLRLTALHLRRTYDACVAWLEQMGPATADRRSRSESRPAP